MEESIVQYSGEQSASGDETFVYIFWLIFAIALFVVPALLMYWHYKKSKVKIERLKKTDAKRTPEEKKREWHEGHKRAVRTVCIGGGAFLGVKLFGIIGGLALAAVGGLIGGLIADAIWSNDSKDLFEDSEL